MYSLSFLMTEKDSKAEKEGRKEGWIFHSQGPLLPRKGPLLVCG